MSGFEEVNYYFCKAARIMDLSPRVEKMLITPYREVKVDVSITLDTGELGTFIGYQVQHDKSRGLRMDEKVVELLGQRGNSQPVEELVRFKQKLFSEWSF